MINFWYLKGYQIKKKEFLYIKIEKRGKWNREKNTTRRTPRVKIKKNDKKGKKANFILNCACMYRFKWNINIIIVFYNTMFQQNAQYHHHVPVQQHCRNCQRKYEHLSFLLLLQMLGQMCY